MIWYGGNFLIHFKYADFSIEINCCWARILVESRYLHFARKCPLLLCEKPSATTIVFGVTYARCPASFFWKFMLLLPNTLWNVQHLKSNNQCKIYNRNKTVNLEALTMKYECITCLLTYTKTIIVYSWDTYFFLLEVVVPPTNFTKSHPTFQGEPGNTGLTLLEEWCWKLDDIYYSSYWWASDPFLSHRDLAARHVWTKCTQHNFFNTRDW